MSLVTQLSPFGFFAAGLAASGHCALMCSPLIALSASTPSASNSAKPTKQQQLQSIVTLQMGRVTSYTAMGAVAGYLGGQFNAYISPGTATTIRLIMLALMMVLLAMWWFAKPSHRSLCHRSQHSNKVARSPFARGAVLALLPCPLLFTALIYCSLTLSPLTGGLSMLSFGLAAAVLPTFVAAGLQHWQYRFLSYSKPLAASALLGLGIGMTFFMPYLVPSLYCL